MDLKVKNNKIIISHFLNEENFRRLQDIWLGDIHWIYNDGISDYGDTKDFQFINLVWDSQMAPDPFLWNSLLPVLDYLIPASLIRIKANLNPISNKMVKYEEHVDQTFKCKVALYYINDNNGYTMIGDKKVESKSNRMVLFNSNQKHYGTNSTNFNNRIVINFNYF